MCSFFFEMELIENTEVLFQQRKFKSICDHLPFYLFRLDGLRRRPRSAGRTLAERCGRVRVQRPLREDRALRALGDRVLHGAPGRSARRLSRAKFCKVSHEIRHRRSCLQKLGHQVGRPYSAVDAMEALLFRVGQVVFETRVRLILMFNCARFGSTSSVIGAFKQLRSGSRIGCKSTQFTGPLGIS